MPSIVSTVIVVTLVFLVSPSFEKSLPLSAIEKAERYCGDHNLEAICICDLIPIPTEEARVAELVANKEIDSKDISLERSIEEGLVKRQELNLCQFVADSECQNQRMICVQRKPW